MPSKLLVDIPISVRSTFYLNFISKWRSLKRNRNQIRNYLRVPSIGVTLYLFILYPWANLMWLTTNLLRLVLCKIVNVNSRIFYIFLLTIWYFQTSIEVVCISPLFFSCSYFLSFFWFTVFQVNTTGLQEHIPVQNPEVVLFVEIYHNVRKGVKVFNVMPTWQK